MASLGPAQDASASAIALSAPLLVGYLLQFILFGLLTVQCFLYYLAFPKDTRLSKSLVSLLYALDTIQSILLLRDAFDLFARDYANVAAIDDVRLTWFSVPVLSGFISCPVQLFFSFTILQLTKLHIVSLSIAVVSLTQCAGSFAAGAGFRRSGKFTQLQSSTFVACDVWLIGSAFCDTIIAVTLVYYFLTRRDRWKDTRTFVSRTSQVIVETGCITAAVGWASVILFLAARHTTYFAAPTLILAKLHSNTCMAVVNRRMRIIGGRDDSGANDFSFRVRDTRSGFSDDVMSKLRVIDIKRTSSCLDSDAQKPSRTDLAHNAHNSVSKQSTDTDYSFGVPEGRKVRPLPTLPSVEHVNIP